MNADVAYFHPRRLGHTNLWVKNLKKSEHFYNQVCGLTVEFTEPDLMASFLGTGHTPHDLGMIETTNGEARYGRKGLLQIPAGVGTRRGLNHIAWELENEAELVAGIRRIKNADPTLRTRTVDHQVAHSIYLTDPDGNSVEFYCDTVKEWRKVLHGDMDLITSAWDPESEEPFTDGRYDTNPEVRVVDTAPVHPRRVTHVVFCTTDVRKMVDYYRNVGGMTPVWSSEDDAVVCLQTSLANYRYSLAIVHAAVPSYHHVSFELADAAQVDAAEKALGKVGITIEKSIDHPSKRSIFLVDPDDMRIEFYARRTPNFADLSGEPESLLPYLI
ncbi:MAG TPA: VOC family protein [Magnetospirillaceae bacterium]|jgi:catechol 2,3-dioxygenase